jgi:hypothetical protein
VTTILTDKEGREYEVVGPIETCKLTELNCGRLLVKPVQPKEPMPDLNPGDVVIGKEVTTGAAWVATIISGGSGQMSCVNLTEGASYAKFLEDAWLFGTQGITRVYREGKLIWKKDAC